MHANRRSQLLLLLLIVSMIACGAAWGFLKSQRSNAVSSGYDLRVCETELAGMSASSTAGQARASATGDDIAINQQLRAAAISARLSDQLVSIEPGTSSRIGETDYTRTPIYVRLNAVSLVQLVGFLYQLAIDNHALTTSDIELSPPTAAPLDSSTSSEIWTADLTLSYLQYAKHQSQSR